METSMGDGIAFKGLVSNLDRHALVDRDGIDGNRAEFVHDVHSTACLDVDNQWW